MLNDLSSEPHDQTAVEGAVEAEPARAYGDLAICRRLLRHTRPHWRHLIGVFLLALLAMPLALLAPVPVKLGVDSFVDGQPLPAPLAAVLPGGVEGSDAGLLRLIVVLVLVLALATELQRLASSLLS